ncbi:hypothetical protein KY349_02575 [Candidatus Woesearchaeota archaeon]|jgi:hypothetical protein|nr:hypothetical protein [Candidatus Woesearchaeota archaeon]
MTDYMDEAKEELKRADHLIFVSLKYTRTCDVIKHVVDRLINCIDFTFTGLLEHLKEQGKVEEVPTAPIPKANLVKQLFPDDEFIPEFADFFIRLRKISKAEFTRACEFRRHVTMTVVVEEEVIKIDIDNITEYFKRTKEFFAHVQDIISPPTE